MIESVALHRPAAWLRTGFNQRLASKPTTTELPPAPTDEKAKAKSVIATSWKLIPR